MVSRVTEVFKIMLVNNIEKLGRSGTEMEVSSIPVRLMAALTIPRGESLLELSGGHLLSTGHSFLHAQTPPSGIWTPHTLLVSPICGTCLAPKDNLCFDVCYRIMTKASFKTPYCYPGSSESDIYLLFETFITTLA